MKQTAVEWLKNEMAIKVLRSGRLSKSVLDLFQQALEIEKQQIKDAYNQGYRDGDDDSSGKDISLYNDADLYYNETYKKNKL